MIGGQVGFSGHITVGDNVQIGAQSGVSNSIPDGRRMMGSPVVDIMQFAKQVVYVKNLQSLYDRVKTLEKEFPNALPYLALDTGYRFMIDSDDYEDVWKEGDEA